MMLTRKPSGFHKYHSILGHSTENRKAFLKSVNLFSTFAEKRKVLLMILSKSIDSGSIAKISYHFDLTNKSPNAISEIFSKIFDGETFKP